MWQNILTGLALYLIIEGMIPFISPRRFRRAVDAIARLNDSNLRTMGLIAMGGGLLLLFVVRS